MTRNAKAPVGLSIRGLFFQCGGGAVVAKECGLSEIPRRWKYIPEKHVGTISRLSGLSPEQIRPDFMAE